MNIKGYKGFNPGMVCRGKQYAENTVFEEEKATICQNGIHFCVNPFDVLDHYRLFDENGEFNEFAEVESLDVVKYDDDKKYCTAKLRVGSKFSFSDFVKKCVDFVVEKTKVGIPRDWAHICSSGKEEQIGSPGNWTKIGSSGDYAKIDCSGFMAKVGSSGDYAQIGSPDNEAQIGSSGDWAKIFSYGDHAKIGSTGCYAQIGSSGEMARICSSGDIAQIVSSSYNAQISSSGDSALIGSSGGYAQISSSGNSAMIRSSSYEAKIVSSGNEAKIDSSGMNAVICCAGRECVAKAKIGSWITLSEWQCVNGEYTPVFVKTERVDGVSIKEDTYYTMKNGVFVEACYEKDA